MFTKKIGPSVPPRDRSHLGLDSLDVGGATEDQTGGERSDDQGRSRFRRECGECERERQRQHDHDPAGAHAGHAIGQARHHQVAHDDDRHQEARGNRESAGHAGDAGRSTGCQPRHHAQDDKPDDVIEHGRAETACLWCLHLAEIASTRARSRPGRGERRP
jgi:hypothetical protein